MTQPINPYGTDFWMGNASPSGSIDFDPSMRLATGRQLLDQSLAFRLSNPRGTVIDCPNDCLDLRDEVSDGLTQSQINALQGQIQQEVLKDQRLKSAVVTATYNTQTSTLTVQISGTSLYGPFSLTLGVSSVTVTLLNANLPAGTTI